MGADRFEKELEQLLKEHRAELIQEKPHRKWRLPDGQVFTISSTTSDSRRAVKNQISDLKRLLGIKRAVNYNVQQQHAEEMSRKVTKIAEKHGVTMAHDEICVELESDARPDLLSELMKIFGG